MPTNHIIGVVATALCLLESLTPSAAGSPPYGFTSPQANASWMETELRVVRWTSDVAVSPAELILVTRDETGYHLLLIEGVAVFQTQVHVVVGENLYTWEIPEFNANVNQFDLYMTIARGGQLYFASDKFRIRQSKLDCILARLPRPPLPRPPLPDTLRM